MITHFYFKIRFYEFHINETPNYFLISHSKVEVINCCQYFYKLKINNNNNNIENTELAKFCLI